MKTNVKETPKAQKIVKAATPSIEEAIPVSEDDIAETTPMEEVTAETKPSGADMVTFVCNKLITPAPNIAKYNLLMEQGIGKFEKDKAYKIPRYVAEVLKDHNHGIIV